MFRKVASTIGQRLAGGRSAFRPYSDIHKLAVDAVVGDDPDLPRVKDMRQGEKISTVFSKEEFDRRIRRLHEFMADEDVGGVVLTSHHNVNYYSGFIYCGFGRNYALVVTPDKNITVSAGIDGGQPWRRSHGDNVTYTDWRQDNFFHTVRALLGNIKGHLGLEMDHVSVENKKKFIAAYPQFSITDVGEATMSMRLVKSQEEIDLIKNGARIADIGGAAIVDALQEGVPEYEVALASTGSMVREIAKTYPRSEFMDTWTWFQSGINTDGAHNPLTTRQVQKGDILSLNCFPMIAGYYTALERTLFLDHVPSDEHLRLWEINCEVHKRGLQLIQPGATCAEIAMELNDIYRTHNLLKYRSFGYGHSFGSLSHYYGREKALEIREDIETTLVPGMVVSMEPMITIPEGMPGAGGYREHDILVVTENGTENITGFPYGPEHNIIKK